MKFDDFVNCFENICVFNLLPEKPVLKMPDRVIKYVLKSKN